MDTREENTNKIRKKEVYIRKIITTECRKRRCDICIIRVLKRRSEQWKINIFKYLMQEKCPGQSET